MKTALSVVSLPREAHRELKQRAVLVRILVWCRRTERFPLQIPTPNYDVTGWINDNARGAQMIRLNVVERATLQQSDRQVVQPDHLLKCNTRSPKATDAALEAS
ncbi:hypothetical protein [Stenotrophomonas maltophilia]|uniref:hypothetical protein n=1 Tax=Stenotrophomonas maltophilia TaxID=40324 RepID=UPI00066B1237